MSRPDRSPRPRAIGLTAISLLLAGGIVFACSGSDSTAPDRGGTFLGPVTQMAGGSGRVYVMLDRSGAPTDLGVALTEGALSALPAAAAEYVFAMPPEASATPFTHAAINWQPTGHPPAGVYTVPHFDVHFYTITQAARDAILLGDAQLAAKMARVPAAEFVPTGYVQGMAAEHMGLHWNDPAAPERLGEPFTKTFIYGSYDGAFIFAEPMLTKAYLETKPAAVVTPVKLPAQFAARGYQATTYTVGWDAAAKEYRVGLSGLVQR
jgi:hypothetical protein